MKAAWVRVRAGWNTFWFRPEPTSTIAVVRIVFGFVATLWVLSQAPTLMTFYGPDGVLPTVPSPGIGVWSLLSISTSAPVVIGLWAVTLLGAVGVMIGFRTRLATVLLFVGVLSFERRDPHIVNAGDILLRNLAFYLMFAPAGEALSLDRLRRTRDRFWEFPSRAPWALRLMQIQLSVVYFTTLWGKLQGDRWRDGTAVSFALRIDDIHRYPTPGFLTNSLVLSELLTFGTLALELALAVLVWNRTLRPWVLLLGVSLHLAIGFSIMVGFFSLLMLTTYLTFLPPETARRLALTARRRLRGWTVRRRPDPHREPSRRPAPAQRVGRSRAQDRTRAAADVPPDQVNPAAPPRTRPRSARRRSSERTTT